MVILQGKVNLFQGKFSTPTWWLDKPMPTFFYTNTSATLATVEITVAAIFNAVSESVRGCRKFGITYVGIAGVGIKGAPRFIRCLQ